MKFAVERADFGATAAMVELGCGRKQE